MINTSHFPTSPPGRTLVFTTIFTTPQPHNNPTTTPRKDDHTMLLSSVLRDLATLYRRYGDVQVLIETPTQILPIANINEDIWNVDTNISVILETPLAKPTKATKPTKRRAPDPAPVPTH
jgi:hypothetical protein